MINNMRINLKINSNLPKYNLKLTFVQKSILSEFRVQLSVPKNRSKVFKKFIDPGFLKINQPAMKNQSKNQSPKISFNEKINEENAINSTSKNHEVRTLKKSTKSWKYYAVLVCVCVAMMWNVECTREELLVAAYEEEEESETC